MNELVEKKLESKMFLDLRDTQKLCEALMKQPHYQKIGNEGIYAIVQKAQSLGINPLEALNGGLYYVKGRVEMQAILMAKMIRAKGHSITMGKESDKNHCILHGKRRDNGDTWKVTFSIEDAKQAGIYANQWLKYPEDMLYSRALSRLARQLFPDVIGNCYVEGELSGVVPDMAETDEITTLEAPHIVEEKPEELTSISAHEARELEELIGDDSEFREKITSWLEKRFEVSTLYEIPKLIYPQLKERVLAHVSKTQQDLLEA